MTDHYTTINQQLRRAKKPELSISSESSSDSVSNAIIEVISFYDFKVPPVFQEAIDILSDPKKREVYNRDYKNSADREESQSSYKSFRTIDNGSNPKTIHISEDGVSLADLNHTIENYKNLEKLKDRYHELRNKVSDKYNHHLRDKFQNNFDLSEFFDKFFEKDFEMFKTITDIKSKEYSEKVELLEQFMPKTSASKIEDKTSSLMQNSKYERHMKTAVHRFDALYEVGGRELIEKLVKGEKVEGLNAKLIEGAKLIEESRYERFHDEQTIEKLSSRVVGMVNDIVTGGFREGVGLLTGLEKNSKKDIVKHVKELHAEQGLEGVVDYISKLSVLADNNRVRKGDELIKDCLKAKYQQQGGIIGRLDRMISELSQENGRAF